MLRTEIRLYTIGISTDFSIAAVSPLAKCLLRVQIIHSLLRYTSVVNLEGSSTPCILGSLLLVSTHRSILVLDRLYSAPLSTTLPVLVVARTYRPFYSGG